MNNIPFLTVAIAGKAGTGKTTVTNLLTAHAITSPGAKKVNKQAPMLTGPNAFEDLEKGQSVYGWDKTIFAAPIKEILGIKISLPGAKKADRRLYQIHKIVSGLYSDSPLYGGPPYKDLVKLVNKIDSLPVGSDFDHYRTFQQTVADLVKEYDYDAFANAVYKKAMSKISDISEDIEDFEDMGLKYNRVLIVGDLRHDNEAEMITDKLNGLIYELKASKDTRKERLELRDGSNIDKKNSKHESEQSIHKAFIHMSIKTDELTPTEVAQIIKDDIYSQIG